ncbi:hypothetical protein GCM10027422_47040 [Hymenobacter arcticus]
MSTSKTSLADQLATAIGPHLGNTSAGHPPKAIAKTLRKLAKQLAKKQPKPEKSAALPTAKQARKLLTGELAQAVQPYLAGEETAPKAITKSVKRLAAQLVKQRRKQAKRTAQKGQGATPDSTAPLSAGDQAPSAPKVVRPAPARRPATNQPGSKKVARPVSTPEVTPQATAE